MKILPRLGKLLNTRQNFELGDGDARFWSAHGTSTNPFEEGRKYRKTTFPSARGLWRISQRLIELGLSVTSHAAVVARGMGKPCVTGAGALRVDYRAQTMTAGGTTMKKGDTLTIDGSTGQVLAGKVPMQESELSGEFATLMGWADKVRRLKVRANADTPSDARAAMKFGTEGIGLCRTEHMFFEADRIVAVREMILADDEKGRRAALAKLLPMQRGDFVELFTIMRGLPV